MSLDAASILAVVQSDAQTLGVFDRVNTHQPDNAPGSGVTCAVWVASLEPYSAASGLNRTTVVLTLNVRVYVPLIQADPDVMDPNLMAAVDLLMAQYSGDYDCGGLARNVDLLGASGSALSAQAGYQTIQDKNFRVVTITLPIIINDLWNQVS